MRLIIFLVLSTCFVSTTSATNYYFSSQSGDDSRTSLQAQNSATPWKTLAKLNVFFISLNPGDSVLFKRGEVFDGSLVITKSGTVSLPIIISAYGIGNKPLINGFTTLSNWVSSGNGIWDADCLSYANVNMVLVNGKVQAMGRYPNITAPNRGYLTLESHAGTTSITDNNLSSYPDWTNAEVVIRKNNWVLDRCLITQHSGNTLSYESPTGHPATDGYGYFVQNNPQTLDQAGEWYFDLLQKKMKMHFEAGSPSSYDVSVSVIDTLVYINNKSNIIFDNLAFQGADVEAFKIVNATNIRIQYTEINFSGTEAISGLNSEYITIENNLINNSNNDGIKLYDCSHTSIKNNTIRNTGIIPGMGLSNNQNHEAIYIRGSNNLVELNKIDSTGYSAITFHGDSITIKNNFVNYFCLTVDDGGGIYGWGDLDKFERKVIGNIISNGISAPEGTSSSTPNSASGIYLDDLSANVEITSNTITNCARSGIFLHNSHEIVITANTLFNNDIQLSMVHDDLGPNDPIRNNVVTSNILFSKSASQFICEIGTKSDDIGSFGSYDSNYYARPVDENGIIYSTFLDRYSFYDLEGWKTRYGYDLHSQKSPVKIPAFTLHNLIGANRFSNATFDTNTSGVFCLGNCTTSWNSGGKLDAGALQIASTSAQGDHSNVGTYVDIGSVEAGKKYLIRFSLLGSKVDKTLKAFLMQNGGAYSRLSETKYFKLSTTRTENELLFSSTTTESNVLLVFEINGQDCAYWIDNMQIYEADVTMNSDEYIRFEYNATSNIKTVSLDDSYVDVKNNPYSNSVSLDPYTSIILIKQSLSLLPLQFIEFSGIQLAERIDLKWITANEANTDHFELEKSMNGVDFTIISRNKAIGISSNNLNYASTDYNPSTGKNFYRIKQVDKDGKYSYSKVIHLSYAKDITVEVSPNPASDKLHIYVNAHENGQTAILSIHSTSGTIIKAIPVTLSNHAIEVDISSLSSGLYILNFVDDKHAISKKFIKL